MKSRKSVHIRKCTVAIYMGTPSNGVTVQHFGTSPGLPPSSSDIGPDLYQNWCKSIRPLSPYKALRLFLTPEAVRPLQYSPSTFWATLTLVTSYPPPSDFVPRHDFPLWVQFRIQVALDVVAIVVCCLDWDYQPWIQAEKALSLKCHKQVTMQ